MGRLVEKFGRPTLGPGPLEGEPCRLVILGLGKLGGREPNYHSHLDVLFLYEGEGHDAARWPLAAGAAHGEQPFLHAARPAGRQGAVAAHAQGPAVLGRGHAAADRRRRGVGDVAGRFCAAFCRAARRRCGSGRRSARRGPCLAKPRPARASSRRSGSFSSSGRRRRPSATKFAGPGCCSKRARPRTNLKRGPGGTLDIEYLVQLLQLESAAQHSASAEPEHASGDPAAGPAPAWSRPSWRRSSATPTVFCAASSPDCGCSIRQRGTICPAKRSSSASSPCCWATAIPSGFASNASPTWPPTARHSIESHAAIPPESVPSFAMIVAIDGPAGAGKSSIARQLAERLGFQFLDTGAMYRAVALAALRQGLGDGDADAIARLAGAAGDRFRRHADAAGRRGRVGRDPHERGVGRRLSGRRQRGRPPPAGGIAAADRRRHATPSRRAAIRARSPFRMPSARSSSPPARSCAPAAAMRSCGPRRAGHAGGSPGPAGRPRPARRRPARRRSLKAKDAALSSSRMD